MRVTDGSSFIVDVVEVWSPRGLASYLEKYVTKGMYDRGELESMGFVRRWSRSRSWPSDSLTLGGIKTGEIKAAGWTPEVTIGASVIAARSEGDSRMWRAGTDLGIALAQGSYRQGQLKRIRRSLRHVNPSFSGSGESEGGRGGDG